MAQLRSVRSQYSFGAASHDGTSEDTFHQKVVIKHLDAAIGSMSMSPANRDIVLGARTGLYIVDLQFPWDTPRFLPGLSTWEVADVQWNIHPARAQWIVSTSGHQALVWNLVMHPSSSTRNSSIEFILSGHTRSVTDINWSVFEPDQLATCALDGWIQTWDLRAPKRPVRSYSGWRTGATQVKWNRQDRHVLASAHDGQVFLWDTRKGSMPLSTIDAHETKIYGLDWNRKQPNQIITCSLDRTIKQWNTEDTSKPTHLIQTAAPVWRARNMPFGDGLMSLPQRSETALTMWNKHGQVAHRFQGHKATCKEFVWRTRGGHDNAIDDRDFQLVTWGRDCELHLWPINAAVLEAVGHQKGGKIQIRMTRQNYEDISYRQIDDVHTSYLRPASMKPAPGLSPMTHRGHAKRSSDLSGSPSSIEDAQLPPSLRKLATPVDPASPSAKPPVGFLIRGPKARTGEVDPISWLNQVTIPSSNNESAPSSERTLKGPLTSEGEGPKYSLGEEIAAAGRNLATRVSFEAIHVSGRTCTVSCYGPWSPTNNMSFIRATFSFPPQYPYRKALRVEISSDMGLRNRATVLRGLRTVANGCLRTAAPALEPALLFLLGERTKFDRSRIGADSSDEEDEGSVKPSVDKRRPNVPIPRQSGVTFGPRDELLYFFARPLRLRPGAILEQSQSSSGSPAPALRSSAAPQTNMATVDEQPKKRRRVFECFGVLPIERTPDPADDDGSESDDVLRFTGAITTSQPPRFSSSVGRDVQSSTRLPFSTVVHLRTIAGLTTLHHELATELTTAGTCLDMCLVNAGVCSRSRLPFLSLVWSTFAEVVMPQVSVSERSTRAQRGLYSRDSFQEKSLLHLLDLLCTMRDVQTLALVACCLEKRRRELFHFRRSELFESDDLSPPKVEHYPKAGAIMSLRNQLVRTPEDRLISSPQSITDDSIGDVRQISRSAASWSSLGALLSSAGLPFKSGVASQAVVPNRTRHVTNDSTGDHLISLRVRHGSVSSGGLRSEPSNSLPRIDSRSSAPTLLVRRTSRAPTRSGATVTFGGTSVISHEVSTPGGAEVHRALHKAVRIYKEGNSDEDLQRLPVFAVSETMQAELECYRLAYAEILHRWRCDAKRLEVTSLTMAVSTSEVRRPGSLAYEQVLSHSGFDEHTQLVFANICSVCGTQLKQPLAAWCEACRVSRKKEQCSVCHKVIDGLSQSCFNCLHVGHLGCLGQWYDASPYCPTGCGCRCVEGGLSGLIQIAPV